MCSPSLVHEEDALGLTRDARLVAIRWDVLQWALVLDLDVPVSELRDAPMRRAWLVFSGVSDLTIPMHGARLPNGVWLTSSLTVEGEEEGFRVYTCDALLPVFHGGEIRAVRSSDAISVRAQRLDGVLSVTTASYNEYGLSYETRNRLATDLHMLDAFAEGGRGPEPKA